MLLEMGITFMIENTDDRAAFWMDRDADGSFSRTGLMGDERIIYGNQRNTIFLGKGSHYISLAHSEWGGNSSLKASFALPDGSIETINPAAQPNLTLHLKERLILVLKAST